MTVALGIAASLGSAACFGAASATQHSVASRGDSQAALDPRLLPRLARQPLWLIGGVLELGAVALQLCALRWAAVGLVQPLLVLGLPIGVLLAAALKGQAVPVGEWAGLLLCASGVAAVAVLLPENHAASARASEHALAWMLALIAVAVVAAVAARRSTVTAAAGAGLSAGVGAAALALCGAELSHLGDLLTSWPPYVAAAGGLLALQLGQAAFQDDRLGAPLATITLVEPITAVAVSANLLGEPLAGGVATRLAAALAVLVSVVGVLLVLRHRPPSEASAARRSAPVSPA